MTDRSLTYGMGGQITYDDTYVGSYADSRPARGARCSQLYVDDEPVDDIEVARLADIKVFSQILAQSEQGRRLVHAHEAGPLHLGIATELANIEMELSLGRRHQQAHEAAFHATPLDDSVLKIQIFS